MNVPDLRHPLPSLDSFERLVRSGPAVLYTAAPRDAFHFTYLSPNIEDLTGFGTDRLLGDPGFWLSRIHPDDLPLVEEEARQAGDPDGEKESAVKHSGCDDRTGEPEE